MKNLHIMDGFMMFMVVLGFSLPVWSYFNDLYNLADTVLIILNTANTLLYICILNQQDKFMSKAELIHWYRIKMYKLYRLVS